MPVSVPMATVRPRSSTSRSRVTTTNCCSRMPSTSRTVSTASKADAMRDAPPTKTCSASSAWLSPRSASTAAATSPSAAASPVAGAAAEPATGRPAERGRPGGRVAAADVARRRRRRRSSMVCFSTTPLASTTTTSDDPRGQRRPAGPSGPWLASCGGPDDDRGVVGQVGQQAGWCRAASARSRRGPGRRSPAPAGAAPAAGRPADEVVDEEPVALLGGHPAGAGVGLVEVALALEGGHLVADGRRRHGQAAGARRRGPSPTGWAVSMYSSTTARRMAALRSSSMVWHSIVPSASVYEATGEPDFVGRASAHWPLATPGGRGSR